MTADYGENLFDSKFIYYTFTFFAHIKICKTNMVYCWKHWLKGPFLGVRARNPANISNLMSFKVLTGVIILKCKSYSKYTSNFSRTSTIIPNITTSASRIFHGSFKYFFSPGDHKSSSYLMFCILNTLNPIPLGRVPNSTPYTKTSIRF